jgi:hypothetical protein
VVVYEWDLPSQADSSSTSTETSRGRRARHGHTAVPVSGSIATGLNPPGVRACANTHSVRDVNFADQATGQRQPQDAVAYDGDRCCAYGLRVGSLEDDSFEYRAGGVRPPFAVMNERRSGRSIRGVRHINETSCMYPAGPCA